MVVAIKVDEDLPTEVASLLRNAGHDVRTVYDQCLSGLSDDQLWPMIQQEQRVLVTADKGVANARVHPPGSHAGIVLFRLPRESRRGYIRLAEFVMSNFSLDGAAGAIVVASPDAIRVLRA
jgi:predicted nuclease of predicted toxin-antitoxin system